MDPRAAQMMQELLRQGYDQNTAATLVGRFQHESANFDPRVLAGQRRGDGGTAAYAPQWRGERLAGYERFARGQGMDPRDPRAQMRGVGRELRGPEGMAGRMIEQARTIPDKMMGVNQFERPAGFRPGGDPTRVAGYDESMRNAVQLANQQVPNSPRMPMPNAQAVQNANANARFLDPSKGPAMLEPPISNTGGQPMGAPGMPRPLGQQDVKVAGGGNSGGASGGYVNPISGAPAAGPTTAGMTNSPRGVSAMPITPPNGVGSGGPALQAQNKNPLVSAISGGLQAAGKALGKPQSAAGFAANKMEMPQPGMNKLSMLARNF